MKNNWIVERIGSADIVGNAPTQEAARKLRKQIIADSKNNPDFSEEKISDFKIRKGRPTYQSKSDLIKIK